MPKRPHSAELQKTVPYPRGGTDSYTQDQKITAVKKYVQMGSSLRKVADATGIPHTTLSRWKRNASWWADTLAVVRKEQQDKLDAKLTDMINEIVEEMSERLTNGDDHILANGEVVKKRVNFRDLSASGLNNIFKQRQLIRGEPTSQSAATSAQDQIKSLAEEFRKIASEKVLNSIEGDYVSTEDKEKQSDSERVLSGDDDAVIKEL